MRYAELQTALLVITWITPQLLRNMRSRPARSAPQLALTHRCAAAGWPCCGPASAAGGTARPSS